VPCPFGNDCVRSWGVSVRLPIFEFSSPGPLRDQLVAAVRDRSKTSTTGLLKAYEVDDLPLGPVRFGKARPRTARSAADPDASERQPIGSLSCR